MYKRQLKILPRNNRCKLSPFEKEELQKAVQKMEEFNQQTIILCNNKIETFDDLYSHMEMCIRDRFILMLLKVD